ncbi:TPA: hypothetical protein ACK1V5_002302 [Pseudomonas aeruginosa]
MRSKPLLPALLLVGAGLSPLAQASSDDSCYPDWSLVGGGVCDTLPFLAPGNDTRANLRLLLADAGHWRLVEAPPSEEEKLEGYGLVPFGLFRLLPGDGSQPPAPPAPAPSPLAELARQMGAEALPEKIAGAEFFEGEGSRCRSNDQDSALAFLRQVRDAGLGEAETKALANGRLDLLGACGWEQEELGGVLAQGVESAAGKAFATYLEAAANFYSGRFADFGKDFALLGETPSQTKLGTSLGYVYGAGNSLELFRWKGDKAESGYVCPAIAESAAALAADDKDPKGLNCLGEFILRNGLDGMPLDSQPEANELGGTPSGFKGEVYSRLDGYRLVMDNPKAPREDKAYALFRAINCFAPAGYNTCGQQDIPQAERKQWFRTLKSTYADSSWAKELKYYW